MALFIVSFIVIAVAVLGMAAGVLLGRPAIKGSCGGLNQVGLGNGDCACSADQKKQCRKRSNHSGTAENKI